jgi:hypothetical protein
MLDKVPAFVCDGAVGFLLFRHFAIRGHCFLPPSQRLRMASTIIVPLFHVSDAARQFVAPRPGACVAET